MRSAAWCRGSEPGWRQSSSSTACPEARPGFGLPGGASLEENGDIVQLFASGLRRLLSRQDNWTFLLSLDSFAQCQTCNEARALYIARGRKDVARSADRADLFRQHVHKHARPEGKLLPRLHRGDVDRKRTGITRLCEPSCRCIVRRHCRQSGRMGVDSALLMREVHKLFDQVLGWSPQEFQRDGILPRLGLGSPTGRSSRVVSDSIQFVQGQSGRRPG